ncbi:hypothetical protein L083_6460 [Actinoplanes sp. N902-109]|nr:hypothetical protein L083_6460 [Actinoplanes sp. N902-109]
MAVSCRGGGASDWRRPPRGDAWDRRRRLELAASYRGGGASDWRPSVAAAAYTRSPSAPSGRRQRRVHEPRPPQHLIAATTPSTTHPRHRLAGPHCPQQDQPVRQDDLEAHTGITPHPRPRPRVHALVRPRSSVRFHACRPRPPGPPGPPGPPQAAASSVRFARSPQAHRRISRGAQVVWDRRTGWVTRI